MATGCIVCGGRLSEWDGKTICSGKCRQKRYRDKKEAQKRAYAMGFQVDAFSKMLSDGLIDSKEARELIGAIWDRIWQFNENIKRVEAIEIQREAEKPKKKKR